MVKGEVFSELLNRSSWPSDLTSSCCSTAVSCTDCWLAFPSQSKQLLCVLQPCTEQCSHHWFTRCVHSKESPHNIFMPDTCLLLSSSGATEAEGPEPEEAGAGDGQPQLQEPTAGQESGAAAGGARCQWSQEQKGEGDHEGWSVGGAAQLGRGNRMYCVIFLQW